MQEVQHRMHFYLWQQQETGCMNMSHDDDEKGTFDSQVNC